MLLIAVALVTTAGAAPPSDQAADSDETRSILEQFVKSNDAWLNPRPRRLSYVAIASPKRDDGVIGTYINRVFIDGDDARWEMESTPLKPVGVQKSTEMVIYSGNKLAYLLPAKADLLGKPVPIQMQLPLRQGIQWYTAAHSLRHEGLPRTAQVVARAKAESRETAVLELDFGARRSSVGLGFFHVFLGQSYLPIGRVRMTFRLPDHLLLKEEFLDGEVVVEYDLDYLELGEQHAPRTIRYIRSLENGKPWVLQGSFQNLDGSWLLDEALNIQDGTTVTKLKLSKASGAEIDPAVFRNRGATKTTN